MKNSKMSVVSNKNQMTIKFGLFINLMDYMKPEYYTFQILNCFYQKSDYNESISSNEIGSSIHTQVT